MRRSLILLCAIAVTQSACFGSFAATRALYDFNKGVSTNKWVQELAFLGLIILPAYQLFSLGDILIFNTIEFWGGSNPIRADGEPPRVREVRLADGSTARLVDDEAGRRIEVGDAVFHLEQTATGMVLRDGTGAVISTIREADDGAVIATDAEGNEQIVGADELVLAGDTPEAATAWTLARAAN